MAEPTSSPSTKNQLAIYGVYTVSIAVVITLLTLFILYITKKEEDDEPVPRDPQSPPRKTWSKRQSKMDMSDSSALSSYKLIGKTKNAETGEDEIVAPGAVDVNKAIITPEQLKHYKWECQHHSQCKSLYIRHFDQADINAEHHAAKKANHSSQRYTTPGYYIRMHKEHTGSESESLKGFMYSTDPTKAHNLE